MKSRTSIRETKGGPAESEAHTDDGTELPADADEPSELDESDMQDSDDERWDVFILDDDDGDPLPDYGDFWMPD